MRERYTTSEYLPAWDDLRVPVSSVRIPSAGLAVPSVTQFLTNGSGSTGVFTAWFDADTEQSVLFECQMPHGWDGSAIYPHVHWVPKSSQTAKWVSWGLEYTWAKIGSTFGNTSIITSSSHSPGGNLVASRHYLTALTAIAPSGITQDDLSSMLVCRLFRDATNATYDTYTDTAGLLEIDFHYRMDVLGSRNELTR